MREEEKGREVEVEVKVDEEDEEMDEIVKKVRKDMMKMNGGEKKERVRFIKESYKIKVMKEF